MVKHGVYVLESTREDWRGFMVDYDGLKKRLSLLAESSGEAQEADVEAFANSLELEINKSVSHYETILGTLLVELKSFRTKWAYLTPQTLPTLYKQCKDILRTLDDALLFLTINSESCRKVLKKAEKETKKAGKQLFNENEHLQMLLRPDNLSSKFDSLRLYDVQSVISDMENRLAQMRESEEKWAREGLAALPARSDSEALLRGVGDRLKDAQNKTQWYRKIETDALVEYEVEPQGESTTLALVINNACTFLYMMNYYIIVPTASNYATAIGLDLATLGLLLAMTPLTSCLSSIFYTWWSDKSFRQPLLFCCVIAGLGNFFYAIAYDLQSPALLFTGRLFVGLGGTRAVNRRYVSEYVHASRRTVQATVFTAAGSMGMALGPGIQPLLSLLGHDNTSKAVFGCTFNPFTSPGWIMFYLWAIFFAVVAFGFAEPGRSKTKSAQKEVAGIPVDFEWTEPAERLDLSKPAAALDAYDYLSKAVTSELDNSQAMVETGLLAKILSPMTGLWRSWVSYQSRHGMEAGAWICLLIYFVLKTVQEAFQSATPVVTNWAFGWSVSHVGWLLVAMACMVLPISFVFGYVNKALTDRNWQLAGIIGIVIMYGISSIIPQSVPISPGASSAYCLGIIGSFTISQILESTNLSLLSKTMNKALCSGLWNAGFLSTEFGTFGRVVGNFYLYFAVKQLGADPEHTPATAWRLHMTIVVPALALSGLAGAICVFWRHSLIPRSERIAAEKKAKEDAKAKTQLV